MVPMKTRYLLRGGILLIVACALALFQTGCAVRPKVVLVPGLEKDLQVLVDVIGATELDFPRWQSISIDEYWKPNNPDRLDADKVTLRIGTDEHLVVDSKDPIWKKWTNRGCRYLVIIADLPGTFEGRSQDPRRLIVKLNPKCWRNKLKNLEVGVKPSGVLALTPERPCK